jgi:poly(A) polymerase
MIEPVVLPRSEHPISRRDIDPDAIKVLYRLRQFNHVAYLVGGSVRDLLVGRKPKDFDIGTSAHPYQVKRLFRNCWIIGRRFRLAHVKFGTKVIEVATFRRQVPAGSQEDPADPPPAPEETDHDRLIQHDNTFGTPEEDAFRRDFTVNAIFYDIATFSVIDYVGGLDDIRARLIRGIGDPDDRVREDPVRMLRALALAARLDFRIDPPVLDAIARHRAEIARSAPPRVLEEIYKVLRNGASERTLRDLIGTGLLAAIAPEAVDRISDGFWGLLAALDAYRHRFGSIPDTLTNAVLLGTLLVPLNLLGPLHGRAREPAPRLGLLPLARRDVDRLRQLLLLQRQLVDSHLSPRARHVLAHRSAFQDALTWLDIQGNAPEVVNVWRTIETEGETAGDQGAEVPAQPRRRRRSRRRRGPRPTDGHA